MIKGLLTSSHQPKEQAVCVYLHHHALTAPLYAEHTSDPIAVSCSLRIHWSLQVCCLSKLTFYECSSFVRY